MRRGMVLERDAIDVLGREAEERIAVHAEGAVAEGAHGVDPGLLGRVDEAGVDPGGHPVHLRGKVKNLSLASAGNITRLFHVLTFCLTF